LLLHLLHPPVLVIALTVLSFLFIFLIIETSLNLNLALVVHTWIRVIIIITVLNLQRQTAEICQMLTYILVLLVFLNQVVVERLLTLHRLEL